MPVRIEQVMSGYDHGHFPQASSLPILGYQPKRGDLHRPLHYLSDLSGYTPYGTGIPPHLTLFPLREWYVVQRTWEDTTCGRRGCVLSHALLVPIETATSSDLAAVCALHRRPESATERAPYQTPLDVELPALEPPTFDETCDRAARSLSNLWHRHPPAVVFYGTNEAPPDDLLLRSWRYNQPQDRRLLAASTFALSVRTKPDGLPFPLSLAPQSASLAFDKAHRVFLRDLLASAS